MADSKSVIEHLEDIEEQLKSKESEQVTISSLIGEPFDPYFDSSTIYYYESDERRFDKHKQRQITKIIISLIALLVPFALDIALSVITGEYQVFNLIADLIYVSPAVGYLVYALKQKRKKLANSKWNIRNHVFYKYENKLGEDNEKGTFAKIMIAWKAIGAAFASAAVVLSFLTLIGGDLSDVAWLYFISCSYLAMTISIYFSLVKYDEFYFRSYIFDNKDSYVLYEHGDWKKISK